MTSIKYKTYMGFLVMSVLVTGTAGFIGFHVAADLLNRGEEVIGVDNLNTYYDIALKRARLARLQDRPGFTFECVDVADHAAMLALTERYSLFKTLLILRRRPVFAIR